MSKEMTVAEYKKVFKECSFFPVFKKYIENKHGAETVNAYLDRYTRPSDVMGYVSLGFDWGKTAGGVPFWLKIDGAWKNFVKSGDIKYLSEWHNIEDTLQEIDELVGILRKCSFFPRFLRNYQEQHHKPIMTFFKENTPLIWIGNAFKWGKTKEGLTYWRDIDVKWSQFIDNANILHLSQWYNKVEIVQEECPKENKTNDEKVNPKFSIEARKKRQGKLNFAL